MQSQYGTAPMQNQPVAPNQFSYSNQEAAPLGQSSDQSAAGFGVPGAIAGFGGVNPMSSMTDALASIPDDQKVSVFACLQPTDFEQHNRP